MKTRKTILSRAMAFNPTNVNKFFNNLENVLSKHNVTPDRIFNCDETGHNSDRAAKSFR